MQVQIMPRRACRATGAISIRIRAPAAASNRVGAFLAGCVVMLWTHPAASQDAPGQFDPARLTVSETLNFLSTATSNAMSAKPGQKSKNAYIAETSFAYTFTDWYQLTLALPTSLSGVTGIVPGNRSETLSWNGVTVRNLFITPGADKRDVFYGLSVQFAYTPQNAALPALANTNTQFSAGLTPIIGFHHGGYELILSPTMAFGFGSGAMTALAPAARLTRKITETFDVGVEYASALGQIGSIAPSSQQAHIVYGITDFKVGAFDVNLGVGYGLTTSSHGLAMKFGISHGF
jgi:hypothetical protein